MFEKYRNRYLVFMIVAAVMFVVLVVQLFVLTVVNGESYSAQAQTKKTRVISLTGNRGTIYDVNGTPLAYDEVSYNIEFYKDPTRSASSDRAYYTEIILKYSNIDNPFSLEEGDFIIAPSFSNVYYNVKDLDDHEKDD